MSIRDEVGAVNQRFMTAFRERDAATLTRLYAQGAVLLPPGHEPITGPEAVEGFWQGAFEAGFTELSLETASVEDLGYSAIELGQYVMHAGDRVYDRGKYMVVWRHENGKWKLYRDMWSSNSAQAASAT